MAIEAEGLCKGYGSTRALRGVDLAVPAGTVLGLLGPNGAGKTTTVRTLATLLVPDGGRAEVAGYDVVRRPHEVRRRIGLAGQYAAVDELLTGRENLVLIGTLLHLGRRAARARAAELLDRFDLTGAGDRPARTYSGGMRRRLDLAACLVARPSVLFLDEPTTGLDPVSRMSLWSAVRELVADGVTVLLTTQYLEEADYLADRIVVVDAGRVIADGTPNELKRKVGEERLEIVVTHPDGVPAAVSALRRVTAGEPVVDRDRGVVSIAVGEGVDSMDGIATAAAALRRENVAVADFALRRPTLDDVFVSLTGRSA
ncbi:ATP-binding cassette domain-containing protein [Streptomyces sp. WAC05374]|uniref:ATP-binding cassette domain-containing protein n=1 Tax=Streptomyces sp. WAC05374 TaxID=2487420 RepID=UPI000F87B314|nr:ATP-binding cassette domain-containing protein [Streptomyces sp. WAC05374]RST18205.1 ATP-binding cassette domain-containing protein [Streptomyces sp. WAC05374]TDF43933.1 ATP-binding cassette domain-containing protein [Streptomyces sp. WAC05374]TDF52131.1 ATP-binding cassette domain-containing protein [Streptomyces sp. WAC05374]TDF54485.1 ATP-binding cassette domain-containing protein [Streptomyces sp. WAC05374]